MKILTAAQMGEVDRLTMERGIPGSILMENAGSRAVDYLRETFAPLARHRIVVFCGKGNNGGDGFVIARQLFQRRLCAELTVVEAFPAESLSGDAAPILKSLIDGFADRLLELESRTPRFHVVDFRGKLDDEGFWQNEMHPNDEGFGLLGEEFVNVIESWAMG